MASGLRKASVLNKDLPPVIRLGDNEYGYLARFRIISEDRNRFSSWSTVQNIVAFDLQNLPGEVDGDITALGNSVFITWDDQLDRPSYDIFINFDEAGYEYHGTSPVHSYSIINNRNATSIDARIQVESINKEVSDVLTICELYSIMES